MRYRHWKFETRNEKPQNSHKNGSVSSELGIITRKFIFSSLISKSLCFVGMAGIPENIAECYKSILLVQILLLINVCVHFNNGHSILIYFAVTSKIVVGAFGHYPMAHRIGRLRLFGSFPLWVLGFLPVFGIEQASIGKQWSKYKNDTTQHPG